MIPLSYNQTQYTVIALISLFLIIIGLYLTYSVYKVTKSRPLLYLIAIHLLLCPYYLYQFFLYFLVKFDVELTIFLFRGATILITIISLLLVFFIESLRSEKPSTIITMVITFGAGINIVLSIMPETFLWDPEVGPFYADFSRFIVIIEFIGLALIIFYQISQFLPSIPSSFKKTSYLFFIGWIFPIIGPGILVATKISLIIWGIEILALAVGVLIVILAIMIDDRVLRILPFNVYRLSVINMDIGLSIFDVLFEVKKQGPDENILIPHLMTANIQFVQSIIAKTEKIRFIKTDNYNFIFESLHNVTTFLIADEISLLLRSALKEFTKEFVSEFASNLDAINVSQYIKAEVFINKFFSFLPPHKIISISS